MSKLDELIKELCPNGVEYKRLRDIATISRGGSFQKKDFTEHGIPCIHYGQIYTRYGLSADKTITYIDETAGEKAKYAEPNDIVMAVTSENVNDVCKCVAWIGSEKVAVSGHTAIIHHNQNAKYLSYYFNSEYFYKQKIKLAHGTKVIEVMPDKLGDVKLPVPPLEVQREIVHILDSFTSLTAELTAELTARKKQYEFYRNKMLTFDTKVTWKRLDEITNLFRGEYITKKSTHEGTVPVILGGQEPAYYIDKSNHEGEIVVVARSGVSAGFVSYWNEQIFVTDGFGYEGKSELIITKYLYYILKNIEGTLNAMKRGAGVPHISGEALSKITLPIPQIAEQKRIVGILDRFDVLCNDLSNGLPAEIEARKKQYEYYRDKLLTFKGLNE